MILFFDKVIRKILTIYRNTVFIKRIRCDHKKVSVLGDLTLINTNITCGENVTIYPNVMFWGDGPIVIGNNVDIGNGTVIYSSKTGG